MIGISCGFFRPTWYKNPFIFSSFLVRGQRFLTPMELSGSAGLSCFQRRPPIFSVVLVVKNLPANARDVRDVGSIPGSRKSCGEGNGNPFQYSCLESPMDRGAWWDTVHGVAKTEAT